MGGRARKRSAALGLPDPRGRLPRNRPVPVPAEAGAAAPRPRGREPRLPRLGTRFARAPVARRAGTRQPVATASARNRERRRQRSRAAARDRVSQERLPAARDDRPPRRPRRERRGIAGAEGNRAQGGGSADEEVARALALNASAEARSAALHTTAEAKQRSPDCRPIARRRRARAERTRSEGKAAALVAATQAAVGLCP